MTLNDVIGLILRHFTEFNRFAARKSIDTVKLRPITSQWLKMDL